MHVAGGDVWSRGRGNDLQHSVFTTTIITGPDFWQAKCQQLPIRLGTKTED